MCAIFAKVWFYGAKNSISASDSSQTENPIKAWAIVHSYSSKARSIIMHSCSLWLSQFLFLPSPILEESDIKVAVAALAFILSSAAKHAVDGESLNNELQQLGLPKGETDRETDRQTDIKTEKWQDRQTDIIIDRQTSRETDRNIIFIMHQMYRHGCEVHELYSCYNHACFAVMNRRDVYKTWCVSV